MIQLKRNIRMLFVFLLLAGAAILWLTPAGTVVADNMRPLLVQVMNDGASPVPVTGTTSISGTADVNVVNTPGVTVNNTPSVNIANQPTVNAHIMSGAFVGIDPANNTVQVASSAGTPLQMVLGQGFNISTGFPQTFDVPAGKRLVIEFVSANCSGLTGPLAVKGIRLRTTFGGVLAFHNLPIKSVTSGAIRGIPFVDHTGAEATKIYSDPGTQVRLDVLAEAADPSFLLCNMVVSGLLVDP